MKKFKAYINGAFVSTTSEVEIFSPLDNQVAGTVPALDKEHIREAFQIAKNTFSSWKRTSLLERKKYLENFNKLLLDSKEELGQIISNETGKLLNESIVEVERTFEYIEATIKSWENIKMKKMVVGSKTNNIARVPLGVVLAISPFNYPINLAMSKIAPALLTGNTVVFKPATNGSLTGGFIATLIDKANFPKGVFNLVTGRGRDIGDELIQNENIDMISFTGSVEIGKRIGKHKTLIPLVLELGGNDAGYVRYDANLDLAAKEIAKGAFSFSGQRCTAIKRVILNSKVKDAFYEKLIKEVEKLEIVPLVTPQAAENVKRLIEDSKKRNDKFILKGQIKDNFIGAFIVETSENSLAFQEEAFGPLLPILVIDNEENLEQIFNNTNFGLQNSIFTNDVEWAKKFAINIESGTVNINRSSSRGPDIFPFLGVKDSGFGTQGIEEALKSMTRVLNIIENE